jgi:PucR C-terminal helix-turn-helix domain/GGDEF-like domain
VLQEVERSGLAGRSTSVRDVLKTLGALLDHFTASVTGEYQQERERAANSPELRRTERVQRLLAGGRVESRELGYELDAWHLGLIAMGGRARQTVQGLAAGLGQELLSVARSEETVWAWLGGKQRPASGDIERQLSARESAGFLLAIGEPGRGIDGWRLTHRQAQAAMAVALREPKRVTRFADVGLLAAVLRDEELAGSLVNLHLSLLGDHRNGGSVSRETLRAYLAAGNNAATAAAALGVVRQTVERRIRTIEQRIGRPVRACHAELEVALRLEELGETTRLAENNPVVSAVS